MSAPQIVLAVSNRCSACCRNSCRIPRSVSVQTSVNSLLTSFGVVWNRKTHRSHTQKKSELRWSWGAISGDSAPNFVYMYFMEIYLYLYLMTLPVSRGFKQRVVGLLMERWIRNVTTVSSAVWLSCCLFISLAVLLNVNWLWFEAEIFRRQVFNVTFWIQNPDFFST